MKKTKILIVEDEIFVAKKLQMDLERMGYTVTSAVPSGELAIKKVKEESPDIVLMDIMLEGEMDGIETTKIIQSNYDIPVIYLTAYEEEHQFERAKKTGATGYITKPFKDEDLKRTIEIALYKHKVEKERKESVQELSKEITDYKQLEEKLKNAYDELRAIQKASVQIMEDLEKEIMERKGVEKELKVLNESLEQRVKERTKNLEESNEELQKEINIRKQTEEELNKYKTLFDNISDLAYICDTNGKILFVNNVSEKLSGHKPEEIIGNIFTPYFDEDSKIKAMDVYNKTLKGESPQYELRFKDTGILCEYKNLPLRDEKGSIIGVIGIARDITERKQLEENLKKSEGKYRRLIEGLQDNFFFYSHNTEGVFTYLSPSITNVLGYSPEEFLTHYSEYMTDCPSNENVEKYTSLSLKGIKQPPYEVEVYHKNGSIRMLNVQELPILGSNGKVVAVEGIAEDVTERKCAEKKLIAYQQKLQTLVFLLSTSEGRERRQIAEGLHDHIGPSLIVVGLKLKELQKQKSSIDFDAILNESCKIIDKIIQDIKSLMFKLDPPILYKLDFETAVGLLIGQYKEKYKLKIEFKFDKQLKIQDKDLRAFLFKSIRELLFNIFKHANAHQIKIKIKSDCDKIIISVEDDGIGFNPHNLDNSVKKSGGFGLFSISERLKHIGGEISVESKPDHGTRIILSIPLMHKMEGSLVP